MIATVVHFVAPWVWRREERIAEKLFDFAATEAGSALDMFAAAELSTDPKLRRLFFRHALDEARHARMFTHAAQSLASQPKERRWSFAHATRQNLFKKMELTDFLAFVHVAEKSGEAHFAALAKHFDGRDDLSSLLSRIAKDERFHVSYSLRALKRHDDKTVRRALMRTKTRRLWAAWRRQGRIIGDFLSRMVLTTVFLTVLPWFAVALRLLEPEQRGWKKPNRRIDPRGQF